MRAIAFVLAGCILLAGCGIFKNTSRKKSLQKVEASTVQTVTRDDSAKVVASNVRVSDKVDTSGYVVKEVYERTTQRPDLSFPFSGPLVNGVLQVQSGLFTIAVQLDSTGRALSGVATVPGAIETEHGTRTTTGKNGITERETETVNSVAESGSKTLATAEEHVKSESSVDDKKSTVDWKLYAFIGLVLAGVVLLGWFLLKK